MFVVESEKCFQEISNFLGQKGIKFIFREKDYSSVTISNFQLPPVLDMYSSQMQVCSLFKWKSNL